MKRWSALIVATFIIAAFSLAARAVNDAAAQGVAGWITLFDGKNLDNWNQIGTAKWKLEDGAVVADNGNGFLVSKNDYTDFDLRAEF